MIVRSNNKINELIDSGQILEGLSEYIDNAGAILGGLSVGDYYYNTTDSKITKVV